MSDPLSDVMALLDIRNFSAGALDGAGDWAVRFSAHRGVKCYSIVSGQCWLAIEGEPDYVHLQEGDCFVLSRYRPFCAANNPTTPAVEFETLLKGAIKNSVIQINGGGECFIAGGHFTLAGDNADFLLEQLPPVVHLTNASDKAELRWALDLLRKELHDPKPGGRLIAQHLAHMMLLQALRLHLSEGSVEGVGLLSALADRQMNEAISLMHKDPAHHWTVAELANRAGLSRSIFALKFKQTVGKSPMEYLTLWRMMLAGERLKSSNDTISDIALSLGYESQSAFSKAFKKTMGCSPREHGRASPNSRHKNANEEIKN